MCINLEALVFKTPHSLIIISTTNRALMNTPFGCGNKSNRTENRECLVVIIIFLFACD